MARRRSRTTCERWWEILDAQAHESAEPLNPQLLFHELSKRLPDQAILTSDSGSGDRLVGAAHAAAERDEDRACRERWRRCARPFRTRWRRSSRIPIVR